MINKKAAPITVGLMVIAAGITCTTVGHYADIWIAGYVCAVGFALFAAMAAGISGE